MLDSLTDVVLVIYKPDIKTLKCCIDSIHMQVRTIWVIDNCSINCNVDALLAYTNVKLIQLEENRGIAHAQNLGIKKSLENKSKYILLSDQDTIYPENFINQMILIFNGALKNIAAVAPLFHNTISTDKNDGFIVLSKLGYSKIFPKKGIHSIYQAIASGLIIRSSTLNEIGLMNAALFIDWVDYEWCWRVIANGYQVVGNANIVIEHTLGDNIRRLSRKAITIRTPLRHYYIIRNNFYLAIWSPYLDFRRRLFLLYKGVSHILAYSFLATPKIENFKMTVLGLYHGVTRRLGRLD